MYSAEMIKELIVPAMASDIRDTQEEKLEEVMQSIVASVDNEKKRMFRESIESRADDLYNFFFLGCCDSGKELSAYALKMVKRSIKNTSLWEFPPSPSKRTPYKMNWPILESRILSICLVDRSLTDLTK
jgi:hypothetical protein